MIFGHFWPSENCFEWFFKAFLGKSKQWISTKASKLLWFWSKNLWFFLWFSMVFLWFFYGFLWFSMVFYGFSMVFLWVWSKNLNTLGKFENFFAWPYSFEPPSSKRRCRWDFGVRRRTYLTTPAFYSVFGLLAQQSLVTFSDFASESYVFPQRQYFWLMNVRKSNKKVFVLPLRST